MQFTAPPLSLLAPVYFSSVKDEVGSRMEMLRGVSLLVGSLGTTGPALPPENITQHRFLAFAPLDNRVNRRGGVLLTRGRCRPPQAAMPLCSELMSRPKKAAAGSRPERTMPGGSSRAGPACG